METKAEDADQDQETLEREKRKEVKVCSDFYKIFGNFILFSAGNNN